MRTKTKRDKVWLVLQRIRPEIDEFQVQDIQAKVAERFDTEVSEQTVRGVIRTQKEEEIIEMTDDGKHFVRLL